MIRVSASRNQAEVPRSERQGILAEVDNPCVGSCPKCGSPVLPSATSCAFCGSPLTPRPVAVTAASAAPTPSLAQPPAVRPIESDYFASAPSAAPAYPRYRPEPLPARPAPKKRAGVPGWVWLGLAGIFVAAGGFVMVSSLGKVQKEAVESVIGAEDVASADATQATLRNAAAVEASFLLERSSYTDDLEALRQYEPGVRWVQGAARDGEVSVLASPNSVVLSSPSRDGRCWSLRQNAGQTTYASGSGACTASDPPGSFAPSWPAAREGAEGAVPLVPVDVGSVDPTGGPSGPVRVPRVPSGPATTLP